METLLICPLKKEWSLLAEALSSLGVRLEKKQEQGKWYYEIPQWSAVLCEGRPGHDEFAERLQFWIKKLQATKKILTLGACGALSDQLKVGDVVTIHEVTEVRKGQVENPRALMPLGALPAVGLLALQESLTDAVKAQKWTQETRTKVIAWETVAGMETAQKHQLPYSEWRAVTDHTDAQAFSDFNKNLPVAMTKLAEALAQHFQRD